MNERKMAMEEIKSLYNSIINIENSDPAYARKLALQLTKFQKEDGSFSVIDDYRVDGDIRVAYAYEPTYYGTAALMNALTKLRSPERREELQKALDKGLKFAMGRRLQGHGFSATAQQLKALKIYKDAGLYEWMSAQGNRSDETAAFSQMITEIIDSYRQRVNSGNTRGDWDTEFRKEYEKEISDYDEGMMPYVWYACYGSNINSNRFQNYINRCTDTSAPKESRPFAANGAIYFAADSTTWGRGKGVAFLDETAPGTVLLRIYKISRGQFTQVQQMEGSKYTRKLQVGTVEGIPVYTFTAQQKRNDFHEPSLRYVQTILDGLMEIYPDISETTFLAYLFKCGGISKDARTVVAGIKKSEHAVTVRQLKES